MHAVALEAFSAWSHIGIHRLGKGSLSRLLGAIRGLRGTVRRYWAIRPCEGAQAPLGKLLGNGPSRVLVQVDKLLSVSFCLRL